MVCGGVLEGGRREGEGKEGRRGRMDEERRGEDEGGWGREGKRGGVEGTYVVCVEGGGEGDEEWEGGEAEEGTRKGVGEVEGVETLFLH